MNVYYLGFIPNWEFNSDALSILQSTTEIFEDLAETYNILWEELIFNESSWWIAILLTSGVVALLAVISVIYEAFQQQTIEDNTWKIKLIAMALLFSLAFGNNGLLMRQTLQVGRGFEVFAITRMGQIQLVDLTISEALDNVGASSAVATTISRLQNECQDAQGDEKAQCYTDLVPRVEEIVEEARANLPPGSGAIRYAQDWLDFAQTVAERVTTGNISDAAVLVAQSAILNEPVMLIFRAALAFLQSALAMGLEVAALIHAALLPYVVAFIFTNIGEDLLKKWVLGWLGIFLIKFCYLIAIGIGAYAVTFAQAEITAGTTLLIYMAIVAPTLAYSASRLGGAQVAQVAATRTTAAANTTVNALTSVTSAAVTGGSSAAAQNLIGQVTRNQPRY